jgi:hypothetical protein
LREQPRLMYQQRPMLPDGRPLFDYDEASAKIHFGYTPEYIRNLCDRGVLVRGEHWILRHEYRGRYRWRVRLITAAGIDALMLRLTTPIWRIHGNARVNASRQNARQPPLDRSGT